MAKTKIIPVPGCGCCSFLLIAPLVLFSLAILYQWSQGVDVQVATGDAFAAFGAVIIWLCQTLELFVVIVLIGGGLAAAVGVGSRIQEKIAKRRKRLKGY